MKIQMACAQILFFALLAVSITSNAESNSSANAKKTLSAKVFQINAQTKLADINKLSDSSEVVLPNGTTVQARRYKKIAAAIQKIQKLKLKPPTSEQFRFKEPSAAPVVKLNSGSDLTAAAKRSDSDVVELPNGKRITVQQLKQLAKLQQKISGQSPLAAPAKPVRQLSGKAIKVYTIEDIKKLSSMPDNTVLETATGKRATLGELRMYAKVNGKGLGERK